MATVGLAGTISCFIFGGLFLIFAFISWSFSTLLDMNPLAAIILGGMGCALLVIGWWIGSLTKKDTN